MSRADELERQVDEWVGSFDPAGKLVDQMRRAALRNIHSEMFRDAREAARQEMQGEVDRLKSNLDCVRRLAQDIVNHSH